MKRFQIDIYQILAAIVFLAGITGWTVLAGMNSFVSAKTIQGCMAPINAVSDR